MTRAEHILQRLNEFISNVMDPDTAKKVGIGFAGGVTAAHLARRSVKRKARQIAEK